MLTVAIEHVCGKQAPVERQVTIEALQKIEIRIHETRDTSITAELYLRI
jgi:hypothetical protein